MTALAIRLQRRYFGKTKHPYAIYEDAVRSALPPGGTLLDAGCGRAAPVLTRYRGVAGKLIGVDMVDFTINAPDLKLINGDIGSMRLESASVDVIMARSVMEHVERPTEVYAEAARVLKPGGHFIFLTANAWDYASVIARLVPNRWHPKVVSKVEGRKEHDVFPTQYKTNTRRTIGHFAKRAGFAVGRLDYLGQYPCYFMFNAAFFMAATAYEKLIGRFQCFAPLRGWILADLVRS